MSPPTADESARSAATASAGATQEGAALNRVALRTALVYAAAGVLWIGFSDQILEVLVPNRQVATAIAMAKGWLYVGVTSVLLYLVLRGQLRRWKNEAAAHRRAAQALATSEARLANALTMAHAGHWEYDVATNLFTFNDHFYRVLRTTAEREGGYTMTPARYVGRFLLPEDAGMVGAELRKTIESTDPDFTRDLEHRVIFGDGTHGDIAVRAFRTRDREGRTIKIYGINQDITHQKQAGQALRESQSLYQSLVDNLPAGVFRKDAAGRFVFVNEWFCRVERCPPELFLGRTATEVADELTKRGGAAPHDWHQTIQQTYGGGDHHKLIMQTGRPVELEEEWVSANGERRYFQAVKTPVFGAEGTIVGSQGVLFEITERKRAEAALRHSEEEFRLLFANNPMPMWVYELATLRFLAVNQAAVRHYGYTREEFHGMTIKDIRPPEDVSVLLETVSHLGNDLKDSGIWRHRRKDGTIIRVQITSHATVFQGRPARLILAHDLTQQLAAEAALRASEENLQLASRVGGVGTFEHDHLTGETRASPVLQAIDGLGATGNRLAMLVDRIVPEDRAGFLTAIQRADDPARDGRFEHEHRLARPDGSVRWLRLQAQTWFAGDGAARHPVRTVGTIVDITERKHAEDALRANEARYRSLFENMLNGFAHCQMIFEDDRPADFIYLAVNKAFTALTGLQDVVGRKVSEVVPGIRTADPQLFELYGRVARTGVPEKFEIYVTALQQWFDIAVYCPSRGYFVTVFDVITVRKKAEEGLRTLSRAIEQSPVSIVITNPAGVIEYVNPRFTDVSGYTFEEVRGKTPRILKSHQTKPEQYQDLWATITAGREWHGELCNRKKSGELVWEHVSISPVVDDHGRITHFVAVKEDITERRNMEEQLRRTQRLEAIGALSSGIAHDLNNILAPVMMAPALLRNSLRTDHERHLLSLIEQSARRGSDIVRQLLTFSRGSGGERVPLQVRHLLKEMRAIVSETFPREIELLFDSPANLLLVLGDATQLHQVLLNLCVNARDAMPAGGTLTLQAANVMVDAEQVRMRAPVQPGAFVVITVTDTGHGIPAKFLERIFDPFFTTKEPGKGTGLGLSTVLGIVRSHGGFMEVESVPDRGTTFRVFLPAAPSELPVPPSALLPDTPRGQGELLLVVDDEPSVRAATRLVLEGHGYRTLLATRGDEALELFRPRAAEISLVFTDIMMPVMNGIVLIRELRKIRPDVKVVVTTGMASDSKQQELAALGITELLPKPCGRRELLEAIHGALVR